MIRPHLIAVLALDGVIAFDLGTATQVFHAAFDQPDERLYQVRTCTPGGRPVASSAGFTIVPEHGLELLAQADTILVAGVHYGAPVMSDGTLDEPVRDALRSAAQRKARVMSLCTGAFVLAAAGLLDGRQATTHWAHAGAFRELFPNVDLDPDVLFVDEGPVLTSAGVGAGIDLCLQVVRHDHGSDIANMAARRCVVPPLAGRRSVAVHRAPGPGGDRHLHSRGPGVGAATPGPDAGPARARGARPDERAHVHPPIPR